MRAAANALEALSTLRLLDVEDLAGVAPADIEAGELDRLLERLAKLLAALADEVEHRWFRPAERPRQMVNVS